MKTLTTGLAIAALAACGYTSDLDDPKPEIAQISVDTTPEELRIDVPAGPGIQYLAWSSSEEKALSEWVDSLGDAESKGEEYRDKFPTWTWTILWREKPGVRPVKAR